MNAKTILILGLKVVALTIILYLCYPVADAVTGIVLPSAGDWLAAGVAEPVDPIDAAVVLLVVCACQAVVLSHPIIRSRWTGWRLVLTIFSVHYGVMTFLSAIEAVVFLNYLVDVIPTKMIPHLFVHGAVVAALFSPLAVLIHGKMSGTEQQQEYNPRLVMDWAEWVWRLVLIAVVYLVIYLAFGGLVFMPLAGEAFQSYYGDLQGPAWVLLLQLARGIIWAALAVPVIRMMKGQWWETCLAVALLFSVLMGFLLLLPNPIMPDAIRRAHFVEVTSSNFLFGWIVAWVLHLRHGSIRDLFRGQEHPNKREVTL